MRDGLGRLAVWNVRPLHVSTPTKPYSTKTLAYCAGLVVVVYWLPFIYLAVVDPKNEGRGGMALCMALPLVFISVAVSIPEIFKAVCQRRDETSKMPILAFSLFGVTVSPLAVFILGFLRNA